jgi:amino acid transporter
MDETPAAATATAPGAPGRARDQAAQQRAAGSALAKYMILAVALSAIGSTLATLVSGVREAFAMGADGVLPRALARTHPRFRTPRWPR